MPIFTSMGYFFYIILSFFLSVAAWARPSVVQGQVDVSSLRFDMEQTYRFHGTWRFYWRQLISENDLRQKNLDQLPNVFIDSLGKNWQEHPDIRQSHGYGTYVLKVEGLQADPGTLAIQVSQFFGTHRLALWFPDRGLYRELGGKGRPGTSMDTDHPVFGRTLGVIDVPVRGEAFYILLQSSEYHIIGAFLDAPIIGSAAFLQTQNRRQWATACWLIGLFTMLIISNFCLFLLRRDDIPSLTVAALSLFLALRFIATEGAFSQYYEHPSSWFYLLTLYIFAWSFPLAFLCYFSFLRYAFPEVFSRRIHRLGVALILIYIMITLRRDISASAAVVMIVSIVTPLMGYLLYKQVQALARGIQGAAYSMLGVWLLIFGIGHDAMVYYEIISSPYLAQYAMLVFTALQSLVVARNFTFAFQTARHLSTQLQEEVALQTAQLQEQNQLLAFQKAELAKAHDAQKNWNTFLKEQVLQRFLPPEIADDVAQGKITLFESPIAVDVTILFADLCSFTRATERLGAEKVGLILNTYFVSMTEIIFSEGGMVDKFIGDGIMAVFGVPHRTPPEDQVRRALRCAVRMQTVLDELNSKWRVEHSYSFAMRIGLHRGPAVFGSFGGAMRSDFTVIGPAVNVASRIEAVTAPDAIYFSSPIRKYLIERVVKDAGLYHLKGLEEPVRLYELDREDAKDIDSCLIRSA